MSNVKHPNDHPSDQRPNRDTSQQRAWLAARRLRFKGPGAIDFLQGYLTCDTQRINAQRCIPMAICNLQGRVVANGWVYHHHQEDSEHPVVELIVHKSLVDRTAAYFKPYVAFASCDLEIDPAPGIVLAQVALADPPQGPALDPITESVVTGIRIEIDLSAGKWPSTPPPAIDATLENALIGANFVWVQAATSEQFLPQVLGLSALGAVDFDKGCYLGQEIVARAEFRGAVKKGIQPFLFTAPPSLGEKFTGRSTADNASDETVSGVVVALSDEHTSDKAGQAIGLMVSSLPPKRD